MPIADLIGRFYDSIALADSVLQFWTSITFGVIVAVHFVGHRMRRVMYLLMSGLYALVSIVSIARYLGASQQTIDYLKRIRVAGYDWPVSRIYIGVAGYGTLALLLLGTFGTLYFMYSVRRAPPRDVA